MNRRTFLAGLGSAMCLSAARREADGQVAAATTFPADIDADPCGGFSMESPRQLLFTDLRHIDPGDLGWRTNEGKSIPLINPPQPVVPAVADAGSVPRGIRIEVRKANKEGPINGLPTQIIHDGGLYRTWGLSASYPQGTNFGSYTVAPASSLTVRYGESKDGYAWDWKPAGEVKVSDITGVDGGTFFIDPHGPPAERYKCLYHALILGNTQPLWEQYQKLHPRYRDDRLSAKMINALFGMVSPDGLKWEPIPEPLMIHKGDTDNSVYYDAWLGKYVLYTRLYWLRRRMIARAESDDFRHWTPVDPIIWAGLDDPYSYDIYTNGRTCYPGLPEHHLMFPMFYRRYTQTSEIHLYSSLDGIRWDHVPGGPVLAPGDPGTWDGEYIVAGRHLVPLSKDRIAIPYSGSAYPHKYPRWPNLPHPPGGSSGWAWWPKGRLTALVADEEGEFRTFPVPVMGKELRLNAKIHRAGKVQVGLRSVQGRTVDDADPINGDGSELAVTWKGDAKVGVKSGETVTLQIRLRAAELYGLEWA